MSVDQQTFEHSLAERTNAANTVTGCTPFRLKSLCGALSD